MKGRETWMNLMSPDPKLTHLDKDGKARMVDVGGKAVTARVAKAAGRITMQPETLKLVMDGVLPKGDVLAAARIAGIMAAKKTNDLIPLCHPLALSSIEVDFAANAEDNAINITSTVKLTGKTGVEMEALTAVSIAALTLYDMAKAVDKGMVISDIRLIHKSGGKSDIYNAK